MDYLLDTHTLLWSLFETRKLSSRAKAILEDPSNAIFVSGISFWEISLKFGLGKLDLPSTDPSELPDVVAKTGFIEASLENAILSSYHQLESSHEHRDPFDRMLIWQSLRSGYCLVSKDKRLSYYKGQGLRYVW